MEDNEVRIITKMEDRMKIENLKNKDTMKTKMKSNEVTPMR